MKQGEEIAVAMACGLESRWIGSASHSCRFHECKAIWSKSFLLSLTYSLSSKLSRRIRRGNAILDRGVRTFRSPLPCLFFRLHTPIQSAIPRRPTSSLLSQSTMKLTLLLALGAMTAMAGTLRYRQNNDNPHCIDGDGTPSGVYQSRM